MNAVVGQLISVTVVVVAAVVRALTRSKSPTLEERAEALGDAWRQGGLWVRYSRRPDLVRVEGARLVRTGHVVRLEVIKKVEIYE